MDDIQSVGNGEYNCADEIEEWSAFKQITITVAAVIGILPHVIVALVLIGYSVLKHAFHLVFPEPLRSIRGQLAVVMCDDARMVSHNGYRTLIVCHPCRCDRDHGIEIPAFQIRFVLLTFGLLFLSSSVCIAKGYRRRQWHWSWNLFTVGDGRLQCGCSGHGFWCSWTHMPWCSSARCQRDAVQGMCDFGFAGQRRL